MVDNDKCDETLGDVARREATKVHTTRKSRIRGSQGWADIEHVDAVFQEAFHD